MYGQGVPESEAWLCLNIILKLNLILLGAAKF